MSEPDYQGLAVGGLTPLTTIDYPGALAAVVYCQGCPWRCRYCHNAHLQPRRAADIQPWSKLLDWLEGRRGLLDAVVFSGGEPTLQRGLASALAQVRALGFRTGLHSAGIYPERLTALLPLLDWVGLDIKAAAADYPAITRVPGSGARAWESARRLLASGLDHEIRLTVHPALIRPARAAAILHRLRQLGARRLVLQPCDTRHAPDPVLRQLPPADLNCYEEFFSSDGSLRDAA
jgi:pyruvate formate lyase activating enzyme